MRLSVLFALCFISAVLLVKCQPAAQKLITPPPVIITTPRPAPVIVEAAPIKHLTRNKKQKLINELDEMNNRISAMRQKLNKINK